MGDDEISAPTARALQHRLAVAQHDGRVPSVVAAIARRADPVWFGAAGTVDDAAPTPTTQYRIGSITKVMVAVCVMRLVERGTVRLSDPIGDHLPDAPAGDSTVFQLLTHTSGLASETPPPWWERTSGASRPQLRDIVTDEPRRHDPGQRFHYSNPGFGLLGALVARHARRPWFDVLADEVLAPLGMTRTSYEPSAPYARGWAVHPWADVLLPEPAQDHGLLAAAGQLWSTPEDLCRFGVFLAGDGGEILSRDTLELMRTPSAAPHDADWTSSFGLGVQLVRFGDLVMLGHTGSMPGFLAVMMSSIEDGMTLAIQANAWSSLALRDLHEDLVRILREREPTMPQPWQPAAGVDGAGYELIGPWYWGAVPVAISLRGRDELRIDPLTDGGGRAARFAQLEDGRWRGLDGYYAGEYLQVIRDNAGAITHLDIGSFVLTREPYAPGEVVPGGLDEGDWQR